MAEEPRIVRKMVTNPRKDLADQPIDLDRISTSRP